MVRTQTESSTAPGIPGGSRQGPTMDGTAAEPRPGAGSLQHAQPPPQPRKKRPEDFKFGKILGEGSFSTVSIYCCCVSNGSDFLGRLTFLGAYRRLPPRLVSFRAGGFRPLEGCQLL